MTRSTEGPTTAVILAGAMAVAALVGLGGDFPLSDDWSYAHAVRSLCTTGTLDLLPWTGASLVFQAWYGALLCRFVGFSFVVLRVSTYVLAVGGVLAFAGLLRRAGVRGPALALGLLLLALDPLYVNLAFTFMTDVPFTVFAIGAGYAYVRGLGEHRTAWLVAGSIVAAAALLVRQHGIFVAMAASLAALLAGGTRPSVRVGRACAAGVIPALAFVAFHVWLFGIHGAPAGYESKIGEARRWSITALANCTFRGVEYLGLLLSPLLLAIARPVHARARALLAVALLLLTLAAVTLWLREGVHMFYLTNVIHDFGLGPLSLRDTQFLALGPVVQLGPALTIPLTVVATVGAAVLLAVTAAGLARLREPVPAFLLLTTLFLFAGTLLHVHYYFDRYLLAVLPYAIATVLVLEPPRRVRPAVWLGALAGAWFAVAGTHDYLAWNRARYDALAELEANGVPVTAVDGGMEHNAWRLAATLRTAPTDAEARPGQPPDRRSWWWVIDDRWVIAFRPLDGYAVRRVVPWPRWLVPGTGRIFVLERR